MLPDPRHTLHREQIALRHVPELRPYEATSLLPYRLWLLPTRENIWCPIEIAHRDLPAPSQQLLLGPQLRRAPLQPLSTYANLLQSEDVRSFSAKARHLSLITSLLHNLLPTPLVPQAIDNDLPPSDQSHHPVWPL